MTKVSAATCFLLLVAQSLFAQTSPQLTPAEILARVSSVYASCRTYSDEGDTSINIMARVSVKSVVARPFIEHFLTAFVQPDAFRFEFQAEPPQSDRRYIAWKAGRLEKRYGPDLIVIGPNELGGTLMGMFP